MPAGLKIINAGGYVQIDQDYFAYGLKATHSITPGSSVQHIDVTNSYAPMLAFNGAASIRSIQDLGGGTRRYNFLADCSFIWVFDRVSYITPPESFGLEVFKADGSRAFHSSLKPLRIAARGAGTFTSGRTYGVVNAYTTDGMRWDGLVDDGLGNMVTNEVSFYKSGGVSGVTTDLYTVDYASGGQPFGLPPNPEIAAADFDDFLVVDVTNY